MKKLIGFTFLALATLSSSFAAGLSAEDFLGDFSGDKGCIIEIRDYPGNMLEISYIKKGQVQHVEFLAKYHVETISDEGSFKVEREYPGFTGSETKIISGEVKNSRLTDIKIERRLSVFTSKTYECNHMVQIGN